MFENTKELMDDVCERCQTYNDSDCWDDPDHYGEMEFCKGCVVGKVLEREKVKVDPKAKASWKIHEYEYLTCSRCGHGIWTGCESTREAKEKLKKGNVPKHCGNCGADMSGMEIET